jgi:hypothetical protein
MMDSKHVQTPPEEHPRLFIRKKDLPVLRENRTKPEMLHLWERLVHFSKVDIEDASTCDYPDDVYVMEAKALMYVLDGDTRVGLQAKAMALRSLKSTFNPHYPDISRTIGRLMLSASVVYDWCRDLITDEERSVMVTHLKRLALLLECGYPPERGSSSVGHASEWMLMRDLLGTGIAIFDEDPDMFAQSTKRLFAEMVPVRNFFYPSGWHHQGDNYGSYRYQADLYATWIMDRMGAGNPFHPSQENVGYQWIYTRRPDGKLLRDGDTDNPLYAENRYIQLFPLVYLMAGSYYNNPYFLDQHCREFPSMPDMYVFHAFLFYNATVPTNSIAELPLTRYFGSPTGIMIARTGWDEEIDLASSTVIAEMRVGEYQYNNHQHLDAGSFQLYYKGYLAIDSGIYKGSSGNYHSPHNKYYFKRTIAHNSVLVYDPDELGQYPSIRDGGLVWPNVNDGGQRWPNDGRPSMNLDDILQNGFKRGEVLAHAYGPDPIKPAFSYLKGDITAAYSSKMKQFQRSFLFLNLMDKAHPATFIVFDRVVSAKADFKKFWLLHGVEEPQINGSRMIITRSENGYNGQLIADTLLPEPDNQEIVPIGGPGKEFWVFGTNYENDHPDTKEQGAWRIEVSPKRAAEQDYFLHVMQVKDKDHLKPLDAVKVETETHIGASIGDWIVLFSKSGLRIREEIVFSMQELVGQHAAFIEDDGSKQMKLAIADLKAGLWQTVVNGVLEAHHVTDDGGLLYLNGVQGEVRLISGST